MSLETLFSAAGAVAMAGWLALLVAPGRSWANWRLAGQALPALLALLYAGLLAWHAPGAEGGFATLADVARLFATPGLLLAGWVHYLAFDLAIGAWICRRGTAEGVNPWLLRLCLPPTFLAGPIGLLLFLGLRAVRR
ncbi:ABA4-like family protein [Falsiroseomonas selenitidurans]|uniref:DUF4281 domain-containing protein n=1 Tax=Falsiroseomonas selenitidurans TaxID=2716335 RepID=A0ABX1E5W9_9PROT|nr:ABA4-like family protein [Falsiroseomonas selenitidurans]NKC32388.1 DUF4281 domain-containing protein [Falsiroseomonas selenitidurans]